jgi:hypothetical protein
MRKYFEAFLRFVVGESVGLERFGWIMIGTMQWGISMMSDIMLKTLLKEFIAPL